LHYLRLPKDIGEDHVILMDCTVSTGAAAMMAIRVLLVRVYLSSFSLSLTHTHTHTHTQLQPFNGTDGVQWHRHRRLLKHHM